MSIAHRIRKILITPGLVALAALAPVATLAGDHGGGAPEPMVLTVNVRGDAYAQFGLLFETGSPEAAHELLAHRPKIQHQIILLMSDKEQANLRTLDGKKALAEEIVDQANHIIHDDRKTGVKEILFTKFLIH